MDHLASMIHFLKAWFFFFFVALTRTELVQHPKPLSLCQPSDCGQLSSRRAAAKRCSFSAPRRFHTYAKKKCVCKCHVCAGARAQAADVLSPVGRRGCGGGAVNHTAAELEAKATKQRAEAAGGVDAAMHTQATVTHVMQTSCSALTDWNIHWKYLNRVIGHWNLLHYDVCKITILCYTVHMCVCTEYVYI